MGIDDAHLRDSAGTSGTNGPRGGRGGVLIGVVFAVVVVVAVLWSLFPIGTKLALQYKLGSLPFATIAAESAQSNARSLANIGEPRILVDVPADAAVPILVVELKRALESAERPEGWEITAVNDPSVTFQAHALRVRQKLTIANPEWGTAELHVAADAVPSYENEKLTVRTALADTEIDSVDVKGFHIPWLMTSSVEAAVLVSLGNINKKMPSFVIPVGLPDSLVEAGVTRTALLVGSEGVSVMLGTEGTNPANSGDYKSNFVATAKRLYPDYKPGSGVIASGRGDKDLTAETESMRRDSITVNLEAAQGILGINEIADPSSVDQSAISNAVLVSVSPSWLEEKIRQQAFAAIKNINGDITLSIPDDGIAAKVIDGAIEVSAKGKAGFMGERLTVDFSAVAWASINPSSDGFEARFALRELRISTVSIAWEGRESAFHVPYDASLGSLITQFVETASSINIALPKVPIAFKAPEGGAFRLVVSETVPTLQLEGRSVFLSPRRVLVLASPKVTSAQSVVSPGVTLALMGDQFSRFAALMEKVEELMGGPSNAKMGIMVAKPSLANMIENAFAAINPRIEAAIKSSETSDAGEIQAIPGNASCGNPCASTSSCGNLRGCTIDVCRDVVVEGACRTFCPGGRWNPICREVCDRATQRVCGTETDNSCVGRINQCLVGVAQCTTAWASGLQATCEAALAMIRGTDFTGFAKVRSAVAVDASGETHNDARLQIADDLSAIDLSLVLAARAKVDASVDITWTDFGNLLICPSGKLNGTFNFAIPEERKEVHADLSWNGGGDAPLVASITPGKLKLTVKASEPPLQTLVKSNPGLLTCTLGSTIVGLGAAAMPKITRELVADTLRGLIKGDNGQIAAALIDGVYSREEEFSGIEFAFPDVTFPLLDETITVRPSMSDASLILSTVD